ncbi:MAG: arsenate reductase [Latescibacteria bacterium DG_63]|nr:MAG: arsenate reductase [Latescibacteria bacterium DG_63]
MKKIKVLFVCEHNSARSQMAEAFLNSIAGDKYEAYSAGLEPGTLNPLAIEAMKEVGIDISKKKTKSVFDFYKRGEFFSYVITVCDPASAQRCPVFPGTVSRMNWNFDDPSAFEGSQLERLAETRKVRDAIKVRVEEFIRSTGR